jgi:carboxyl-terminal processing protease
MTAIRTTSIALSCALVALAAGLWLGGHPDALPEPLRDAFVEDEAAISAEIIDTIEDSYFKKVDRDELRQASLKGIVQSLGDRFSHYFTPEETKLFEESIEGEFDGVGMTVDTVKRGLLVVSVFDGSPAKRAGIRPEDVITQVDGKSIAGTPLDIATARIKGKAGTRVRLTVAPNGGKRRRTVSIRRERIVVPIARGEMKTVDGTKLGVVQLASFTSGAHGQLRQELVDVLDKGAEGIVLDLRGNGGGLLQEAILVASIFIENGTIVSTDGRTQPKRVFRARGEAIPDRVEVVVLVDRGTASSSEIVAGALRDRERATIVGTRTFGKGVFQEVESLSNGGALDLTVGSYFLPSGENLSNKGIKPGITARDDPDTDADEALPVALRALTRAIPAGR